MKSKQILGKSRCSWWMADNAPFSKRQKSLVGNSDLRNCSNWSRSTASNCPNPCNHILAARSASGSSLHHFTRPRFSWLINPARVKIAKCLDTAAKDIAKGSATSLTAMSSSSKSVRMLRRVASAIAAKIKSICWSIRLFKSCWLGSSTKWLNMQNPCFWAFFIQSRFDR